MRRPENGDWIRLTCVTAATLTDSLLGGGIPSGTRGVVLERVGSWVTAQFDTGWGTTRATVPVRSCRVVRRGGGCERFASHVRIRMAARFGVLLVLLLPVLQFGAEYVCRTHSFHGILGVLAVGLVDGTLDTVFNLLAHPVKSIVYLAVLAAMSRFAFGPRPHRRQRR